MYIEAHRGNTRGAAVAPAAITTAFPTLDRWAIGYSTSFNTLEQVSSGFKQQSFPPYNITRDTIAGERWEIVMAVAGYRKEHIDVSLKDRILTVKNTHDVEYDDIREVIHQGIAQRNFSTSFALAEHVEVTRVHMSDGLLFINLMLNLPEEKKPKQFEIE